MFGTEIAAMFVSVGADVAGVMDGFGRVTAGMASVAEQSRGLGIGLAAAGGALLGLESKGFLMAASMEAMFTTIRNNTTMSAADVDTLRTAVLRMGQDTGAGFDQLAEGGKKAMNITGDMAKSLQILDIAQQMAVGTGADVAQVTNVLANAMHEYGADVGNLAQVHQNAAQYMGVMHAAAQMSNMDLQDFAANSGKAIGIAANLGIPIEQVAAAFVALTKHGYDAASAQVQIVDAMTHMISPTAKQTAELKKLSQASGVDLVADFNAQTLATKGLVGVMGDITQAYKNTGLSQAQAEGETMHLMNALRGGLGLGTMLGTGAEDYASSLNALSDKEAMAALSGDVLARTQETAANQWQRLQRSIEVMMMSLGQALGPMVGAAASTIKQLVDGFNSLPAPVQSMISSFGAIAGIVMVLAGGFILLAPALLAVPAALGALAALALPVGALVGILALLKDPWDKDLGGIQSSVGDFVDAISDLWNNSLQPAFKSTAQFLEDRVFPVFEKLATIVLGDVLAMATALARLWETVLMPALQATGTFIEEKVFPFFLELADKIAPRVGDAITWLSDRWKDLQPVLANVKDWLVDHATRGWQWLTDSVFPKVGAALGWLGDRWKDLQPTIEKVAGFIAEFGGSTLGALPGMLQRVGDTLRDLTPVLQAAAPVIGQLLGAFGDFVGTALGPVADLVGRIADAFRSLPSDVKQAIEAIIGVGGLTVLAPLIMLPIDAISLLRQAWDTNFLGMRDTLTTVGDAISSVWNGTLNPALQNFGSFLEQHVFPFVGALANLFNAELGAAVKALVELWNGPLQDAFKATGKWIGDFVQGPIRSLIEWIAGLARAILDNPVLHAALGGAANDLQVFVNSIPGAIDSATAATNAAAASVRSSSQSATVVVNQTNHGVDQGVADGMADRTSSGLEDLLNAYLSGAPAAPATSGGAY